METAPRERCSTPWMEKQSPSVLLATQCFLRQYLHSSSRALVVLNARGGRQPVLCQDELHSNSKVVVSREQKVQNPGRSRPCSASLQHFGLVPDASLQQWVEHPVLRKTRQTAGSTACVRLPAAKQNGA